LNLPLGVLDQSPIPAGSSVGDALRNSIDLARLVDSLGFRRYWLAEHHGAASLACASPEAMIGPVAAATKNLRVGSGGIMLPHYSPLKVAETFSMLNGLYDGRIDLGIGRAPGTSGRIARALQRDRRNPPPDDFLEQFEELQSYFANVRTEIPTSFTKPELWLLGSSEQSAVWAAERGLRYAFADFINPEGAPLAAWYRDRFVPSEDAPSPKTAVAVSAICAETDAEAQRLASSVRMMLILMFRGRTIPVPAVEEAEQFLRSEGVPAELLPVGRRLIVGSPATVVPEIERVAAEYQAEEALIVTITHSHEARRRSYELIARQAGLS
jgi:luciferase family oxidoreductase group 1